MSRARWLRAPVLAFGAAFALALALSATRAPRYVDFTCYVHGVRSEVQAGVLPSTRPLPDAPGLWAIEVEDAGTSFYRQRHGETCGLERPRNARGTR